MQQQLSSGQTPDVEVEYVSAPREYEDLLVPKPEAGVEPELGSTVGLGGTFGLGDNSGLESTAGLGAAPGVSLLSANMLDFSRACQRPAEHPCLPRHEFPVNLTISSAVV